MGSTFCKHFFSYFDWKQVGVKEHEVELKGSDRLVDEKKTMDDVEGQFTLQRPRSLMSSVRKTAVP